MFKISDITVVNQADKHSFSSQVQVGRANTQTAAGRVYMRICSASECMHQRLKDEART
ncbi:hypothetical protein CDEST_02981 [Colletotrichum destructivum]|uniref:Uncharacterized protein n=1 Tax=Colletotrichum destructivum TaxID=34406 RepID=A0AAX4I3J8_9PEZI|nr:hypothetical protein CDEST_02981 [Colletotrichum destructivum]